MITLEQFLPNSAPGVVAITAAGLTFENNKHRINYNDGAGDFNTEIGVAAGATPTCTENGFGTRVTYTQSTGLWSWVGSSAANTIGNTYTMSTLFSVDYLGNTLAKANVSAYSDVRLKTNIELLPNALAKVCLLAGYSFNRIDLEGQPQIGVLAQEVQAVYPDAVMTDQEGILSVNYGALVAPLIEAIKEQQKQIAALTARLDGLS